MNTISDLNSNDIYLLNNFLNNKEYDKVITLLETKNIDCMGHVKDIINLLKIADSASIKLINLIKSIILKDIHS